MTDTIETTEIKEATTSSNSDSSNKEVVSVPLAKLLKEKEERKAAQEQLKNLQEQFAAIEAQKKKEAELKMLEEKKLEDLLALKNKEIEDLISSVSRQKHETQTKLAALEVKSYLQKYNIHDADDGIKFIDINDLLDKEDRGSIIKERVEALQKTKPYLFGNAQKINHPENQKANSGAAEKPKVARTLEDVARNFWNNGR